MPPAAARVGGGRASAFTSMLTGKMINRTSGCRTSRKTYETKSGDRRSLRRHQPGHQRSEFVAIVGPSGCGKTTNLKMVAGLTPYTSGTITVGGNRVDKPQTDVGIVFQDPSCSTGAMSWRT